MTVSRSAFVHVHVAATLILHTQCKNASISANERNIFQAKYFRWLLLLLTHLLSLLPKSWLRSLLSFHLGSPSPSSCELETTLALMSPGVVGTCLHLGYTEILQVRELDAEALRPMLDKMR